VNQPGLPQVQLGSPRVQPGWAGF